MTLPSSDLCIRLLRYLAEPAIRALALAVLACLALTLGRAKDVAVRLAVWTTVLYAALAMPFLARIAPAVRLPMPVLVSTHFVRPRATVPISIAPAGLLVRVADAKRVGATLVAARAAPQSLRAAGRGQPQGLPLYGAFSWPLAAAGLYLLIAGVLLGRVALGFYFSRRLKLFSNPVDDRRVLAIMLAQCAGWSLRTAPGLAESPSVAVPVTLDAWHPLILLPTAWRAWSDEKIYAVLADELSHVVRRDALTRALAAIHRSVFWFSPLAWWLERHLAALAEQASDDAALRTGADRIFYANVLLGFYQDLQGVAWRVRWEGLAMTRGKQARERVERILDTSRRLSAGLRKPAWAALALLAIPVLYVLAGARPVVAEKSTRLEARALAAPAPRPAADPLASELQAPATTPQGPAVPAAPAAPKPAPAAPSAPKAPTPQSGMLGTWTEGEPDEEVIVSFGDLFVGSGPYYSSDFDHFRALRHASHADFIWFRRNGKAYVIRDRTTVGLAKECYSRLSLLVQTQENLQHKQDLLSAQQEELSEQMDRVRVDVPDMAAELRKLEAQLDQLHKHGATLDQLSELQDTLVKLQKRLAELQDEAGGKLGGVGGRQAELGEEQRKLAEAGAREKKEDYRIMKAVLDDALARGLAQPE